MLAGITLDTKNFAVKTGVRTFEAAAFLRRAGADTSEVKKLLQTDMEHTVARYKILQTASIYRADIAIAAPTEPQDRIVAAQAADEGAVLAVGDRRHGAGVDEIGVAVVGIRAADVAKGQKLLLHSLRFILIDLAAKRITLKFHRVSPKNL